MAATGVGETGVCLGITTARVQGKGKTHVIETYALLDNGADVALCHELLANKLGIDGEKLSFTLPGMMGSTQMKSRLVDLVVKSMDESVAVELMSVKTIAQMPISTVCILKKEDLTHWPHLKGFDIPAITEKQVLLLIGKQVMMMSMWLSSTVWGGHS